MVDDKSMSTVRNAVHRIRPQNRDGSMASALLPRSGIDADTTYSVVVPSYGRGPYLERCVEALLRQSLKPDEILIALRAADRPSWEALARFGSTVQIITVPPTGVVGALNLLVQSSSGSVIAMVDDDTEPQADWLETIARWFSTYPDVGGVGGRDIVHHGDEVDDRHATVVGRITWWGRLIGNHHLQSTVQRVTYLKGANMAYRREALEPFDGRLRGQGAQVCNDLDVSLATVRRGWTLAYDPAVTVDHYPAPRMDDDGRKGRSRAAQCAEQHNELYVLLKHQPRWQRPLLVGYRVLIGYRKAPGILTGYTLLAFRVPFADGADSAFLQDLARARMAALRTWRQSTRH